MNIPELTKPPSINPITMEGSNAELLSVMLEVQELFDSEATWLEEALLDTILCDCPRCWELYFKRLRELHQRDANLQDHQDWREARESVLQHSPVKHS